MNGRIEILRSNTREPYKEISKLDRKFGPLINNYTKLTGEAFPKTFFQKAKAVEMKLIAKMKKAK